MNELNILILMVSSLIILIIILIFIKEYPNLNKDNLLKAFGKI